MKITDEFGYIDISRKAYRDIAGYAVMGCYGVVGMARSNSRAGILEVLNGKKVYKGIHVDVTPEDTVKVDVFCIVEQSVNITAVAENIIEAVKYAIESQTNTFVSNVTVNIVGMRI